MEDASERILPLARRQHRGALEQDDTLFRDGFDG
jgi:hypothetical protein